MRGIVACDGLGGGENTWWEGGGAQIAILFVHGDASSSLSSADIGGRSSQRWFRPFRMIYVIANGCFRPFFRELRNVLERLHAREQLAQTLPGVSPVVGEGVANSAALLGGVHMYPAVGSGTFPD